MIRTCPTCGAKNRIPPTRLHQRATCGKCKRAIAIDAPVALSDAELESFVSRASVPVLVDFWAPWCGPCRMIAPELEKLAKSRSGSLVVVKVNTDEAPRSATKYGISGIPALVLFRSGREAARTTGAMPAEQIARALGL